MPISTSTGSQAPVRRRRFDLCRTLLLLFFSLTKSSLVSSWAPQQTKLTTRGKTGPITRTAIGRQLDARKSDIEPPLDSTALYQLLDAPSMTEIIGTKPGRDDFYNDAIASNLHGYMLLVATFGAQDFIFGGLFFVLASFAAASTLAGRLPPNPRVPALVAFTTLILTWTIRQGLVVEPIGALGGIGYMGPTSTAFAWEAGICGLNVVWGFLIWGTIWPKVDR